MIHCASGAALISVRRRWPCLVLSAAAMLVPYLAAGQSTIPQCRNAGGQSIPCVPAVIVDKAGVVIDAHNPLPASTLPVPVTSTATAGSVTIANAFQSAIPATPGRLGCTLQNTSSAPLFVYVGPISGATLSASLQLPANGTFGCAAGGIILTDQISVTSTTSGATFVVVTQ